MRFQKPAFVTALGSSSAVAHLLLGAAIALTLGSGTAHAQQEVFNIQHVYTSSNPAGCVRLESWIWESTPGRKIGLYADVGVITPCDEETTFFDYVHFPPGHLAVRLVLFKWNGSAPELCMQWPDWTYNTVWQPEGSWVEVPVEACGDGHYNLVVEGCAWVDSGWRCGMIDSGWLLADVL